MRLPSPAATAAGLLKFGFLEDGDSEAIDAALAEDDDSDAAGTDEEEEEEGEGAEALYSDEDSTEVRGSGGAGCRQQVRAGWRRRRLLLHSC
jgi:hypothetical protein